MSSILVNQIECLKCGDKPFSAYTHDFKWCKCESVAVDGGMSYLKRAGDLDSYKELSITINVDLKQDMIDSIHWSRANARNGLGTVCAVMRAIRDAGYKVVKDEVSEDNS